jgi:murein L,D-transpeptidase YafK
MKNILLIIFIAIISLFHASDVCGQKIMNKLEKPKIVIEKSKRKLKLLDGRKLIKTYEVSLGATPIGDKEVEGDGKTPEGEFYIFTKNPESSFFLSLGISYPNIEDAKRGLKQNLITKEEFDQIVTAINNKEMPLQKTKLGGEIYIHGGGCKEDWTQGCIALDNQDMQELFDVIEVGTIVEIKA